MPIRRRLAVLAVLGSVLPMPRLPAAPQRTAAHPAEAAGRRSPPTVEELRERYEKEIAKPFVAKGGWILDYGEAMARAKREDKLVFAYFARSYAY